ncbi:hypothetical protein V2S66_34345, partial [Streptomyces sp. V4-01]|nr:hypothetical protein [Streptomyces sp. V4-01]
MNGPQHFLEAERLLALADYDSGHAPQAAADRRADAQVHATLAQTAAFVMAQPVAGMADEQGLDQGDFDDW